MSSPEHGFVMCLLQLCCLWVCYKQDLLRAYCGCVVYGLAVNRDLSCAYCSHVVYGLLWTGICHVPIVAVVYGLAVNRDPSCAYCGCVVYGLAVNRDACCKQICPGPVAAAQPCGWRQRRWATHRRKRCVPNPLHLHPTLPLWATDQHPPQVTAASCLKRLMHTSLPIRCSCVSWEIWSQLWFCAWNCIEKDKCATLKPAKAHVSLYSK